MLEEPQNILKFKKQPNLLTANYFTVINKYISKLTVK